VTEAQKKLPILNLYLDDSGTRHPSKKQGKKAAHGYDWFALGGVLVHEEYEDKARHLHAAFVEKWGVIAPLHSSEIRSQNEGFLWLSNPRACAHRFHEHVATDSTMMWPPIPRHVATLLR